jgi:hypothetical protein
MKFQIDPKSALFGLVVGVLAVFAIGAGSPSEEIGRYQISAAAQSSAFIVDTKTGQAWGFAPVNSGQFRQDANFWEAKR